MPATSATTSSVSTAAAAASVTTTATTSAISAASAVITMSAMTTIIIPSFPSVAHIGLASDEIRVQVPLRQHFPFTDPHLDTDLSVYGQSEYIGIIDVHTMCMQRCKSLFYVFCLV